MPFRPKVSEEININANHYWFTEHPSAKGIPYGQTGRRATVYQLKDKTGNLHALKVFTLAFRTSHTEIQAEQIERFKAIPGLGACQRTVLTPQISSGLLQQHPDLRYAVLMPWVQGITWQETILTRRPLNPDACLHIAGAFVHLLSSMEEKGIAHCDLSGPNVLLEVNGTNKPAPVSLIDLEDMFAPGLSTPGKLPAGSAGYAHKESRAGVWSLEADRFAGAVLITEMLGWCDERVRRIACGEQYFDPAEMQTACERYQVLLNVILERWGDRFASLYTRAWFANTLKECPSFVEWKRAFSPPSDPEALFSQLLRLERLGRWGEVLSLCDQILAIDPNRTAVWPVRARSQRLLQIEAEIETAWQKAANSGLTDDWEACMQLVNAANLLASQVVRYQAQRSQGESEMETALRIDEIEKHLDAGDWGTAQRDLLNISPMQPRFTALKVKIDQHAQFQINLEKYRQQALEASQNNDWQQTLDILQIIQNLQPLDAELANLLSAAKSGQAREKQLHTALTVIEERMQDGNYDAAHDKVIETLNDWPNNSAALKLKGEIEQTQARLNAQRISLETARQQIAHDHLQDALTTLSGLPAEVTEASQLRKSIETRLQWREKLDDAINTWRMEAVVELFSKRPPGEPEQPELLKKAQEIIRIEEELVTVRDQDDLRQEIILLERLPDDYPGKTLRLDKIIREQKIREKLEKGLQEYDLEAVQGVYEQLEIQDKRYWDLSVWMRTERQRRRQAALFRKEGNLSEARDLLVELPDAHPIKVELSQWLAQESNLREKITSAVDRYDVLEMANLLATMQPANPLANTLRDRLKQEQTRKDRLLQARKLFDGQTVLHEMSMVDEGYPDYAALTAWANDELHRQALIRFAILDGQTEKIEQYLVDLPTDHPYISDLKEWLEGERERAKAAALAQAEEQKRLAALEEDEQRKAALVDEEQQRPESQFQKGDEQAIVEKEEEHPQETTLVTINPAVMEERTSDEPVILQEPSLLVNIQFGEIFTGQDQILEDNRLDTASLAADEIASPIISPKPRKTWLYLLISTLAIAVLGTLFYRELLIPGNESIGAIAATTTITVHATQSQAASTQEATQPVAVIVSPTATPIPLTPTPLDTQTPMPTPTPTLGIGSTYVREQDRMEMLFVPAGEFEMGISDKQIDWILAQDWCSNCSRSDFEDATPAHIVYLDSYWIDKYEVTNRQYAECIAAGACTWPSDNRYVSLRTPFGNIQYANNPIDNVNWAQAQTYCSWVGGNLPTEAQWEKAARGTDGRIFPWGNAALTSQFANFLKGGESLTVEVGSYPAGVSPLGALDMAGNVAEWVADWYAADYFRESSYENPSGPLSGDYKIVRGGHWDSSEISAISMNRGYDYEDRRHGFRCVTDQMPIALVAVNQTPIAVPTTIQSGNPAIISANNIGSLELSVSELQGQLIAFSEDGKMMALAFENMVSLISLPNMQDIKVFHTAGKVLALGFSPDDSMLAYSSAYNNEYRGNIWLRDVESGDLNFWFDCVEYSRNSTLNFAFSHDGRYLAFTYLDDKVMIWDLASGQEFYPLIAYARYPQSLAFSPVDGLLATHYRYTDHSNPIDHGETIAYPVIRMVRIWRIETGRIYLDLQGNIWHFTFSPDGTILAGVSSDGINLWRLSSGGFAPSLQAVEPNITSITFSPGGDLLVSGTHDGSVHIWDLSSGELLVSLDGYTESNLVSVLFTPDGTQIMASYEDGTILIWQVQ